MNEQILLEQLCGLGNIWDQQFPMFTHCILASSCQECKLFSQVIPQFISQDLELIGGYGDVTLRLQVSGF